MAWSGACATIQVSEIANDIGSKELSILSMSHVCVNLLGKITIERTRECCSIYVLEPFLALEPSPAARRDSLQPWGGVDETPVTVSLRVATSR